MTLSTTLRSTITTAMAAGDLSQRALARTAGVDQATLSKFLSADTDELKLSIVEKLAPPLKTTVAGLLGQASAVQLVPPAKIHRSDLNPRRTFDEDSLRELAESIAAHGLLQNLVVRSPTGSGDHELVAGERRWRAIQLLVADGRWPEGRGIPCEIRDIDDETHAAVALIENLQRDDVPPLEEGEAMVRLVRQHGWTVTRLAETIHRSRRHIEHRMAIAEKLTEAGKKALLEGRLSATAARVLARAPADAQADILKNADDPWERVPVLQEAHIRQAMEDELVVLDDSAGFDIDALKASGATVVLVEEGDYGTLTIAEEPDEAADAAQESKVGKKGKKARKAQPQEAVSRATFDTWQRKAASERAKALKAEGWKWAKVVEGHVSLADYGRTKDKAKGGCIVQLERRTIKIHEGLANKPKTAAGEAASTAGQSFEKRMQRTDAELAFTESLHAALAAPERLPLLLALYVFGAGHGLAELEAGIETPLGTECDATIAAIVTALPGLVTMHGKRDPEDLHYLDFSENAGQVWLGLRGQSAEALLPLVTRLLADSLHVRVFSGKKPGAFTVDLAAELGLTLPDHWAPKERKPQPHGDARKPRKTKG